MGKAWKICWANSKSKMIDSGADFSSSIPGGKGTTDMVRRANRVRVTVVHVK